MSFDLLGWIKWSSMNENEYPLSLRRVLLLLICFLLSVDENFQFNVISLRGLLAFC